MAQWQNWSGSVMAAPAMIACLQTEAELSTCSTDKALDLLEAQHVSPGTLGDATHSPDRCPSVLSFERAPRFDERPCDRTAVGRVGELFGARATAAVA